MFAGPGAVTAASLSTGAVILPVLWALAFPKQARQGLHRAGRLQPWSKVSQVALLACENRMDAIFRLPSDASECSGQRCEPASVAEASCSNTVGSSSGSASAGRSFEGGPMASAATEIIEPEATEETSGGCRRSEPTGEDKGQPARGAQDSDDSDDDPILIPPSRLSEQGQRYRPNSFTAPSFFSLHPDIVLFLIYKTGFCHTFNVYVD